jgi:hypothetical protein
MFECFIKYVAKSFRNPAGIGGKISTNEEIFMKSIMQHLFPVLLLSAALFTLASCLSGPGGREGDAYSGRLSYKLVVEGFEWGPSVTKLILTAQDDFRLEGGPTRIFLW